MFPTPHGPILHGDNKSYAVYSCTRFLIFLGESNYCIVYEALEKYSNTFYFSVAVYFLFVCELQNTPHELRLHVSCTFRPPYSVYWVIYLCLLFDTRLIILCLTTSYPVYLFFYHIRFCDLILSCKRSHSSVFHKSSRRYYWIVS